MVVRLVGWWCCLPPASPSCTRGFWPSAVLRDERSSLAPPWVLLCYDGVGTVFLSLLCCLLTPSGVRVARDMWSMRLTYGIDEDAGDVGGSGGRLVGLVFMCHRR